MFKEGKQVGPILWDDVPDAIRVNVIPGSLPYECGSETGSIPCDEIEIVTEMVVVDQPTDMDLPCERTITLTGKAGADLGIRVLLRLMSAKRVKRSMVCQYDVRHVRPEPAFPVVMTGQGDYVKTWPPPEPE